MQASKTFSGDVYTVDGVGVMDAAKENCYSRAKLTLFIRYIEY